MILSKSISIAVLAASLIATSAHASTAFEAKGDNIKMSELITKIDNGAKCKVTFGRKGPLSGRVEDVTKASFEGSYHTSTGYMGRESSELTGEIMKRIHTSLGGGHWLYLHKNDVINCT